MEANPIMKRQLVASMLSLAIAGCAQSRVNQQSPVAMTPVPSVYDTVNRGMGGDALAKTAMSDPADPQWSGRAQAPLAPPAAPDGGSALAGSAPSQSPASTPGPGANPGAMAIQGNQPASVPYAAVAGPPPAAASSSEALSALCRRPRQRWLERVLCRRLRQNRAVR